MKEEEVKVEEIGEVQEDIPPVEEKNEEEEEKQEVPEPPADDSLQKDEEMYQAPYVEKEFGNQ